MKVGIIDNFDSFVYNLVRYVRESADTEVIVQRNDKVDYAVLDTCDAILLSPGPGIPDEAGELKNVIKRYAATKKMLGVCLGHQAIAEVFGSALEQCPEPVHGKSSIIAVNNESTLFRNMGREVEVGRYHSWKVKAGNNSPLKVTAETDDNIIMAFEHETYPVTGVQFHPESILTPEGRKIIANWINA